jgi:hypothetical protein
MAIYKVEQSAFLAVLYILLVLGTIEVDAFAGRTLPLREGRRVATGPRSARWPGSSNDDNDGTTNSFSPGDIAESVFSLVKDMANNFDDQVDDFFNKRMGNGEIFYGKRKIDPSGNIEGDYEGLGLTDFGRIEAARSRKEQFLAEREEVFRKQESGE